MAASPQKVREAIEQAIQNSDEIKPGNYITVKVDKKGLFAKPFIALTGRCASEKDKDTVEKIAKELAGEIVVENLLRVSTVS